MTLTIKDPPDSASPGKPGTPSQNAENKAGGSPRSNPVCLEVPVTVRSLPGEGSVGSSGPIREEGRTVIVFDNGAVLRLANNLAAGQKVIVSNAQGSDVVCRVVHGRNLPTVKGYIEVEFIEQFNDFWRIHQTAQPANVSPPPAPVLTSPLPASVPHTPASRIAPPVNEMASLEGGAPSFEDIAGLVRMSPPPAVQPRAIEPAGQIAVPKDKKDSGYLQDERPVTTSSVITPVPLADVVPVKRKVPQPQDYSSLPVQKPAVSSEAVPRDTLAFGRMSASSSSDSGSRMPLIAGGAILILAGLGAGFFLLHRETAPAPAPAASVQPAAPASPPPASEAQPSEAPPAAVEQVPAQARQAAALAAAVPEAAVPAASNAQKPKQPARDNADVKEPDLASKQRQQIPSLKMGAPSVPSPKLAKLSDASAPNITDVSSSTGIAGPSPASLLSPIVRTEAQPAPPPSAVSSPPPTKTVREPKLISSTRPQYPALARQASTQGTVVVSADVDARGIVIGARAVSGPATLRPAAIDAVKQWKYSPALIDGKPTSAQVTVDVEFRLN